MSKPKHRSIWDYLAWIILFLITIWIILKITGIIQTPIWLQYSPLLGVIYLAGWAMSKLDTATEDIKEIKTDIEEIKKDTQEIETDVDILRKKCPELKP